VSQKRSKPLTKVDIDNRAMSGRYGAQVLPPLGMSLSRGSAAVGTSLAMLGAIVVAVPIYWLILVAFGLRAFPPQMGIALSLPPIGSLFDLSVADQIFVLDNLKAFAFVLGLTVLRAVWISLSVGLIDEALEYRRVSVVGLIRGMRGFVPVLFVTYVNLGLVLVGRIVSTLFGGAGGLLWQATLIGGLFAFAFSPAIAVRLDVPGREVASRSVRAARLPGWPRHLLMVVVYYFVTSYVFPFLAPAAGTTVVPGWETWALSIFANVVGMAFVAGLVFRWREIEALVPAQTAKRTRPPTGGLLRPR
jgi:mannose/fructose/N-acetylgalactosamine-specific phosphotransferase system component IID